jgi:transcription initiation factor TFIID subunit 8
MATMFTGYPPYGTYQAPYPAYPIPPPSQPMAAAAALPHFTPHFPQPPPGYPLYTFQPARAPSPPPGPPTAPDIPTITPQIASKQVRRLIVSQLKMAEFESIEPRALQRLELEVVACTFPSTRLVPPNAPSASLVVQALYEQAHEYANLANRAVPIATDVLLACNDRGLKGKDLHNIALASQSARRYRLH